MITPTITSPVNLDHYASWLRSHHASERTVYSRVWFARRLLEAVPDPRTATPEQLRGLLADPGYSKATRATYYTHTRSVFRWLLEAGLVDVDPTAGMVRPPAPRPNPRPLSPAEAARVLAKAVPQTYDALLLGMYAGLRAHEAAKFHSRDVTAEHLQVTGKGGRQAVLPTHPAIWEAAQRHDGYWFPGRGGVGHISSLTISLRVSRVFWAAGIEGSFHRCRHYYGTSLLRAGVNIRVVQELMRHSSLATTAAYLGVSADEQARAINLLAA